MKANTKTKIFFIPVALLVLGYLHLLTMYASRMETGVGAHVVGGWKDFPPQPVHQQAAVISPPRLTAQEARRQMIRLKARPTVPPMVHAMEGNEIPTSSFSTMNLEDPSIRAQRVVYIITPTYYRKTQRVDLIRLKQTLQLAALKHHAKMYWILIEDAQECSQTVRQIAQESGLAFAHKAIVSQKKKGHRGLLQRNLGLDTIINDIRKEGVIYFADDDNAYDTQLFTELTFTRHTSVFAVGMSGGSAWERCHVNLETGNVDAILSTWKPKYRIPVPGKPGQFTHPVRKFAMDMAGFAFSTTALMTTQARFQPTSTSGMLETDFLSLLVHNVGDLEPLAANCTRILVWHVKTTEPQYFNNPEADDKTFDLMVQLV